MPRRQRKGMHDLTAIMLWVVSATFLLILLFIAQYIGWIIGTVVIAALAYSAGRWLNPAARKLRANRNYGHVRVMNARSAYPREITDLGKARDEIKSLRAQLAASQESEHAAWDATTGPAIHEPREPKSARNDILNDPMSGARPLFREDNDA